MFKRRMALIALAAVSATSILLACVGEIYDSVHFNDARPDFGLPPSEVVISSWGESRARSVPGSDGWSDEEYDEKKEKEKEERINRLRDQADRAIGSEQFSTAKSALQALLKEEIEDAELVRDKLDILTENEKSRVPFTLLRSYFTARSSESGDSTLTAVAADPNAGFLKAFAEYGLAAALYDRGNYKEAAKRYEAVAANYPDSLKKEAALIMAVRTRLRGEILDNGSTKIAPADLVAGKSAIEKLRKDFPSSRFLANATDWETRALYLEGKTGDAFLRYLASLGQAKGYDAKVSVLSSLQTVKNSLKGAEADKVRTGLFAKPELLQPYLEFRLYHSGDALKKELAGLATLAKEVLDKHPTAPVSAGIKARLAEIAYLQGDYSTAEEWADDCLKAKDEKDSHRDLATYVMASSYLKERRLRDAVSTYEKVLSDFEDSYLEMSARENLALLHEMFGEWGDALDQYRALKYDYDVATILDIRMSIDEIHKYIEDHQNDPELDNLKFALGMRYLRKENLDEAERWFKDIPDAKRKTLSGAGSREYGWLSEDEKGYIDLLVDPVETVAKIRDLKAKIGEASTDDAKADAQYALASFWYEHRNLLLYNADLWKGGRSVLAGFWDAGVDKAGYQKAILDHHYEHECLWRARKICVLLVKDHPKTKAAPKALYRAACAARRLANFNPYWRDAKLSKGLWQESIALMKRVASEYPSDPLAKDAAKYAKAFEDEFKGQTMQALFRN
jgi:TolA-binding protein